MEKLTAEQAIEGLRGVVAEFGPNYVYPPAAENMYCQYWHGNPDGGDLYAKDEPGCIVGQVLHRLGWSKEDLQEANSCGAINPDWVHLYFADRIEDSAMAVFWAAQRLQDGGKPWGEALAAAEEAYSRILSEVKPNA